MLQPIERILLVSSNLKFLLSTKNNVYVFVDPDYKNIYHDFIRAMALVGNRNITGRNDR
jgi:hypothetical protein